jgi:cytoskeletal protein RodZ
MTQPPGPVRGPMQPQYPPLSPEPPAQKKKRGWIIAVIVILGLILFGSCVAGLASLSETPNTTATESDSAGETVDDAGTEVSNTPAKSAPKSSAKPKPEIDNTISNGLHEVGVDVQAGQYKTDVPDSESCYWARHKDDSGELDAIIANENIDGPARASVTIKKGEFFESGDCGTWKKVG